MKQLKSHIENNAFIKAIFRLAVNVIAFAGKLIRLFPYKNSETTVLISLHKIGDTVFSFPAAEYLIKRYGSNLKIICWDSVKDVYSILPEKVNLIPIRNSGFLLTNRIAKVGTRRVLKSLRPKIIIDITGSISSASLIWGTRAEKIYGRNELIYKKFYDEFIAVIDKPHLSDRYFDPVKLLDPNAEISEYRNENARIPAADPKILIHPFAGWKAKEWPLENFIELTEKLNKQYEVKMIFERGKIEKSRLVSLKEKKINFIETDTLKELIEEIQKCSIMIGNDSGPINIANYLGIPTVTLFGPTNPIFHQSFNDRNIVLQNIIHCTPAADKKYCFTHGGLYCDTIDCMNELDNPYVFSKINDFISKLFSEQE